VIMSSGALTADSNAHLPDEWLHLGQAQRVMEAVALMLNATHNDPPHAGPGRAAGATDRALRWWRGQSKIEALMVFTAPVGRATWADA
jgi:hypothetical protein